MKPDESSKHLQGITDLTLLAPIKQGLIDALDTRTYATRLKLLMKTLNSLRSSSREFSAFRPFSDGAERIRTIHSLRLAILEPEQKLLLAVTFDRPWEPYIRIIWRDVGTLLDVIFCNCAGYVTAYDHGVAEYFDWVRKAQIDAQFFYNAAPVTVDDLQYLRKTERLYREQEMSPTFEQGAMQLTVDDPEDVALCTARHHLNDPQTTRPGTETTETTGLGALAAIYRLTDVYPADRNDGGYLLRAAHDILKEFRILDTKKLFSNGSDERDRFKVQLDWFEQPMQTPVRAAQHSPASLPEDIQGGILTSYKDVTHGCLVLLRVVDSAKARVFLGGLKITTEASAVSGGIYANVAFTCQGLRQLGVSGIEIEKFPKEFREGMEARADLLGDVRSNHPRNWALPERNWPHDNAAGKIATRVQLSGVDIVVQLRISSNWPDHELVNNPNHPLYAAVEGLAQQDGVQVLSVQAMRRYMDPILPYPREHFGFVDGISQPELGIDPRQSTWSNIVPEGELLLGYANASCDVPAYNPLLENGTFLIVRKLRQDAPALNAFLKANRALLSPNDLKAKMMGRTVNGEALANAGNPPDSYFNYDNDPLGIQCPFQAHIRRVNPRTPRKVGKFDQPTVPRIMRRGMSYGPRFDETKTDREERGLIFMAYNASIAEQFEVIQRWISGGNSTGVFSGQSDPLLGVPQTDDPRTFRFMHGTDVKRVELDVAGATPFVRLEWGAYLFVPSLAALQEIAIRPVCAPCPSNAAEAGEKMVQKLLAMEGQGTPEAEVIAAWKARLEDFDAKISGDTEAVWAAIRENHDGVLRTAYGILVASKKLVMEVFVNAKGCYSVNGYHERMKESIGGNYLGLDQGEAYRDQSGATNEAIRSVTEQEAFDKARKAVRKRLNALVRDTGKATFDTKELSDWVLEDVSKSSRGDVSTPSWFDIPDSRYVVGGGWNWIPIDKRTPQCPGDFTSPSRYLFSPNPGAAVTDYGRSHGKFLLQAVTKSVKYFRDPRHEIQGRLSQKMFAAIPDDDQLARTIVGALMGFLPTVDGNLRSTLYEWVDDKTLWRVQEALLVYPNQKVDPYAAASNVLREPLMRTMQLRPVPDLVWRTAVKEDDLGNFIKIRVGDKIVVGIGSATQEDLANDAPPEVFPIFGGNRNAPQAPTHACPGYAMAMGVLLGTISALLEAGTLYPTPSPTGITVKV